MSPAPARGPTRMIKQLNPYLYFNGNAQQALDLYTRVLGAEVEGLLRFGEVPAHADTCTPPDPRRIAHACVKVGAARLMLSDTPMDVPGAPTPHTQVHLEYDDVGEMRRAFDDLSSSGKVTLALHDTFWGATFGMVTDGFGVHWIFNCQKPASA